MSETELCRLCAETKPDVIGIADAEGEKLSIQCKIAKYLHIEVSNLIQKNQINHHK